MWKIWKKQENWCETNEQMSVQRKYLDMRKKINTYYVALGVEVLEGKEKGTLENV
jgi:hypothetical protein